MSAISDFSTKVNAAFDQIGTAVDGLTADVTSLKSDIAKLQASAGAITPEDQALLDGIEARAESASTKLTALDGLTVPPVAPTE